MVPWTNREATSTRDLPSSLVILGAGPTGVELAQVFARFGVPTALVASQPRILPRDHPRNSAAVEAGLRRDGVDIRTGVRALRIRARAGESEEHVVELSDGRSIAGQEILLAVGRTLPLAGLGLETIGVQVADGRTVVEPTCVSPTACSWPEDVAGPELHTHMAHYQGELRGPDCSRRHGPARLFGDPTRRVHDPEAAGVGLTLEQATKAGYDAFEEVADLATSAKGYVAEASGPRNDRGGPEGPSARRGVHRRTRGFGDHSRSSPGGEDEDDHRCARRHDPRLPHYCQGDGLLFSQALLTLDRPPQ